MSNFKLRSLAGTLAALALSVGCADDAGSSSHALDRSKFSAVGTTKALDYGKPELWACRPDLTPSECDKNLDTTELKADGTFVVQPHTRAEAPAFDCFYVYPTVLLSGAAQMTDFSQAGIDLVDDPLLSQAARFTRVCEVYAPLYRQNGLAGATIAQGADSEVALGDVRAAFAHYLKHDNNGRNFVLMGHSQGTFMLTSLMAETVDKDTALRARMISALLIGGQPWVPKGTNVGGSFQNIPLCTQPSQTGCVVAYDSFPVEAPPTTGSLFGMVSDRFGSGAAGPGAQVACVEPTRISGGGPRFRGSYFPLKVNNPAFNAAVQGLPEIGTPFVLYRDMFRGECVDTDGYSTMLVRVDMAEGDLRTAPPYRNTLVESIGFGLHLVDYNVPLDDLIDAVGLQAAAMSR